MPKFCYLILSKAVPGKEKEFERWYDERHLSDVVAVPGVVAARRYRPLVQIAEEGETPGWLSVAIYELEGDDPIAIVQAIKSRSGSEAMVIDEAFSREGLIQIVMEPVAARTR